MKFCRTKIYRLRWRILCGLALCLIPALAMAEPIDESKLPPPADRPIDFTRDVRPIFENSCFRCHSGERPKGHFRLDDRSSVLKGGDDNQDDIIPGNSAQSKLVAYIAQLVPDSEMPPNGKGEPLSRDQISILRAWIDQGATWGSNSTPSIEFSIEPTVHWISVSGDKGNFMEIEGTKEGWGGGAQSFSYIQHLAPDETFSVEGHALWPDNDYRVALELRKRELGFVRGGFEVYRKYYDDNGAFAPTFPTNQYHLDRDLHLDTGRAWIDFGLTLPDRPQIVLGYEYQFRQGDESTLQLGPVGTLSPYDPNSDNKRIYPAAKHIDESIHIFKADISYTVGGWDLADSARVELYRLQTVRWDVLQDSFGRVPDIVSRVAEHDDHVQGMNTASASKQVTDWWFVSGAYFYSHMEGGASLQQNTLDGTGAFTDGTQWIANNIVFDRESHSASVANLLGPWSGFTASIGVQGDWTHQHASGFQDLSSGNPTTPPLTSDASSILGTLDSSSARENISLRYTEIPYTVLYAEAKLRQETMGRSEDRPDSPDVAFLRETDANIMNQDYRIGFNSSPWSRVSLNASFRHSLEQTDYNQLKFFSAGGYSYPGFILWRDIEGNQVEARLVWRIAPWFRTTFTYRFQDTDYDAATKGVDFVTPGGHVEAARQQEHVFSAGATITPFSRLYLSTTFSYSADRTATLGNGADSLVAYDGNIISLLNTATLAINPKTDLRFSYNFSTSDYGQNDKTTGLPAGIEYERHDLQAGVTHRFTKNVSTTFTYAFSQYREPSNASQNNYTAHGVFATVTLAWP